MYGLCPRVERHLLPAVTAAADMFCLPGLKSLLQFQFRLAYCHDFHRVSQHTFRASWSYWGRVMDKKKAVTAIMSVCSALCGVHTSFLRGSPRGLHVLAA
jgi:hypothetical protein